MSLSNATIPDMYANLTKHPQGSLRELCTITFPLMLSSLSVLLMIFADRLILAHYSLDAMNSSVAAGLAAAIFTFGTVALTSIVEVFVGQYNGAKKFQCVGEIVWQMIWFSLMTTLFFIPMGLFAGRLLLSPFHYADYGLPYFQWFMFFGSLYPLVATLTAFFVGLGKVKLVMIIALISNVLNVVLDIVLIFGVGDYIPELGTKGASIATGISQFFQAIGMLLFFLSSANRAKYGTGHIKLKLKILINCLRVSYPSAIGHMIEYSAWAILVRIIANVSEEHLTIFTIGQSFLILFNFGIEGLQVGVSTVAANFIGAGQWKLVSRLFYSAFRFLMVICAILAIPFLIFPESMVYEFISRDLPSAEKFQILDAMRTTCVGVWFFFLFDGLTWIIAGILTAGADTFFVMGMCAISAWLFAIAPIYFLIVKYHAAPSLSWPLMSIYALLNATCFYLRYKSSGWRMRKLS